MKFFLALSAFALCSNANALIGGDDQDGQNIQYLSWCNRNVVMSENVTGQTVAKFDCNQTARVCKHQETRKGAFVVVSAVCVNPRDQR